MSPLREALGSLVRSAGWASRPTRPRKTSWQVRERRGQAASCWMCNCLGFRASISSAAWPTSNLEIPIIFITGHGRCSTSVRGDEGGGGRVSDQNHLATTIS